MNCLTARINSLALNIDKDGIVWICGTANDTINRFDPKTEMFYEYRLPMRVSYTREIEFDDQAMYGPALQALLVIWSEG